MQLHNPGSHEQRNQDRLTHGQIRTLSRNHLPLPTLSLEITHQGIQAHTSPMSTYHSARTRIYPSGWTKEPRLPPWFPDGSGMVWPGGGTERGRGRRSLGYLGRQRWIPPPWGIGLGSSWRPWLLAPFCFFSLAASFPYSSLPIERSGG
jgi:hypothetical protein